MAKFLKKILWVTDFSDEAQDAFQYAKAFADAFKAEILALHVVPDFSPTLYDTASVIRGELEKRVDFIKKKAEERLEKTKKSKKTSFKTIVKAGNASKIIIKTSEEENVDLIVMGRKGISAIEKIFIGSVANQILRNSSVPILLTQKKSGKSRFNKILVPTDFSAREEIERDYAWKIAKGFNSEITLLHVLELHDYEFSPQELDSMFDSLLNKLKKRKKREKEDINVSEEVVRAINASIGVVDYTETYKHDLIVISTCVHSRVERFFLGSTTEKVISHSQVPIFAIPPSQCVK